MTTGYSKSEKMDPWVSKSEGKGTKSEPRDTKSEPKGSQREPKGSQREPNGSQMEPKGFPKGAKRVAKGSQRVTKMPPKMGFQKRLPKKAVALIIPRTILGPFLHQKSI